MGKALRTIARLGALGVGLVGLLGCSGRLDGLEADAQRLVREHQRQALGAEAANDPNVSLTRPGDSPNPDVYDPDPATTNPSADELPAKLPANDIANRTGDDPFDTAKGPSEDDKLKIIPDVLQGDRTKPITRLDLSGILAYAIANSPNYRTEKESLYLSALRLIIERHQWGPRFFETAAAVVNGTPETGDVDTSLRLLNQLQVTQRLPYGGQVSASALVDYVTFLRNGASAPANRADSSSNTSVQASINLPLLRGAGQVAREPLIQAERNLIYAVRDFERFRRQFLVELSNRYFDLLRIQAQIQNQQRQLKNLERLAARFQALANAGREPAFEAERSQQQVLFGRSSLLSLRENYAAALDRFKIRLGLPTTRVLVIKPTRVTVPEVALRPIKAVSTALDLRLDLQTTRDQVEDSRRQVRVARNQLLPNLDLNADVSIPTDSGRDFGGVDLEPGQGDFSVGLNLSKELTDRDERADYRASLISWERSRRDYQLARDQVAQTVRSTIRQIKQARFTVALQDKNVELAERRAKGVALRERTLGPRDVIEAQDDLLQARNRRDRAVSTLRQTILQFLLSTGQMRVDGSGHWQPPAKLVPAIEDAEQASDVKPAEKVPADEQAKPPADLSPNDSVPAPSPDAGGGGGGEK